MLVVLSLCRETIHACTYTYAFRLKTCSLHGDYNGIIVKNMYFETRFQRFAFLYLQNAII